MSDPTGLAPLPIPDTWLADSDRATLGHGQWYTDGVIRAFQHYLVDFIVNPALQTNMFDSLKFVSPSEVTWFQQFADEGDLITLLENDKHIFLPLNSTLPFTMTTTGPRELTLACTGRCFYFVPNSTKQYTLILSLGITDSIGLKLRPFATVFQALSIRLAVVCGNGRRRRRTQEMRQTRTVGRSCVG